MVRLVIRASIMLGLLSIPCQADLVVHYGFNGDALDLSGKGNNGTIVGGPAFVPGQYGDAIAFENPAGASSATMYVSLPNSASIVGLQDSSFSFAILYRSTDTSQRNGRLFGNANGGSGIIYDYNDGRHATSYAVIAGSAGSASTSGNTFGVTTDGQWHWGIVVVDRAAGLLRQYVDENQVVTASFSDLGSVSFTNLDLGRISIAPNYAALMTAVDDFQLFDAALTDAEIARLVRTGSASVPEPSSWLLLGMGWVGIAVVLQARSIQKRGMSRMACSEG